MQDQIKDFAADLKSFQERFKNEGPGAVGKDLDLGKY